MKKHITLFCCMSATFALQQVAAQSTQNGLGALGHNTVNPATTHYLGWDNATTIDLQIRHDNSRPITFHTGPALITGFAPERMRIQPSTGFVGIGTNAPASRLHSHQATGGPLATSYAQFTTGFTGAASTDGLLIGIAPRTVLPFGNVRFAEISPSGASL